jgi:hypothetical protein
MLTEELRGRSEEAGKKRRYLAGFNGVCWYLWALVDDFRVFPASGRDRRELLAVVGDLWGLWAILGFDACGFDFCAGLFG